MCNEPEPTGERGELVNTASVPVTARYAADSASKGGAGGIFGTPMMFGMPKEVQDALAAAMPFSARHAGGLRVTCVDFALDVDHRRLER